MGSTLACGTAPTGPCWTSWQSSRLPGSGKQCPRNFYCCLCLLSIQPHVKWNFIDSLSPEFCLSFTIFISTCSRWRRIIAQVSSILTVASIFQYTWLHHLTSSKKKFVTNVTCGGGLAGQNVSQSLPRIRMEQSRIYEFKYLHMFQELLATEERVEWKLQLW